MYLLHFIRMFAKGSIIRSGSAAMDQWLKILGKEDGDC
jgi:hypothetical protein